MLSLLQVRKLCNALPVVHEARNTLLPSSPQPAASPISHLPSFSPATLTAQQQLCQAHFCIETSTRPTSSFSMHGQPLMSFKPLLNCLSFQKAYPEYPGETATHTPYPTALLIPLILFHLFSFSKALVTKQSPQQTPLLLRWPKDSFWFSHYILWKNSNELIGQPNTNIVSVFCYSGCSMASWLCVYFILVSRAVFDWMIELRNLG